MNIDIKTLFPKASRSFIEANYQPCPPFNIQENDVQPFVATLRTRMNKTEQAFSLILEALKRRDEITRWEFQGITLRWECGDQILRYTPDFIVFDSWETESKGIRLIEVKGAYSKMPGYLERAVERFRHAKTYWPQFTFELHRKTKDGWRKII